MKTIKKTFFNDFAGAWIFYTIFPKLPVIKPRFKNIAQFAPLIGILIAYIQCLVYLILRNNNWPIFSCVSLAIVSGHLITGGLHIDGLMDTFDGIYAGNKKTLKAMKDSRVGSFGVQSLILVILIQLASLLKIKDEIINVLPICLFWGRLSTLLFINKFKYLNYKRKYTSHKKNWRGLKKESIVSLTILLFLFIYYLFISTSLISILKTAGLFFIGLFLSYKIPIFLGNKVGGVNGDTCGASVVLVETLMIFIYSIFL